MKKQTLWTYDFTVITIGSFVSLVGSILSSFAVSLLILDHTGSTFLYMLYNAAYPVPVMICPVLAGPYLDRASRKKVIYCLDFLSSGIYLVLFLLLKEGWFSYPVLLAVNILTGAIRSIYSVAYDSFYPNLITEGNFGKAYAVASLLEDTAYMVYPLAAVIYQGFGGAAPLFAVNAASFFAAACFETTIRFRETHIGDVSKNTGVSTVKQFRSELLEGLGYMRTENGLLMIALYFTVLSAASCSEQLMLPYFRNHAERFVNWPVDAAALYAVLSNFMMAGRLIGGALQYKLRIPKERKFSAALMVYVVSTILIGTQLFLPVPLIAASFFINGILGVTSYTIRSAATQSYVPDGKRARFNGTFQMLNAIGGVTGGLLVGAAAEVLPERGVIVGANLLVLAAAYLFIWRGRDDVRKVYNREV